MPIVEKEVEKRDWCLIQVAARPRGHGPTSWVPICLSTSGPSAHLTTKNPFPPFPLRRSSFSTRTTTCAGLSRCFSIPRPCATRAGARGPPRRFSSCVGHPPSSSAMRTDGSLRSSRLLARDVLSARPPRPAPPAQLAARRRRRPRRPPARPRRPRARSSARAPSGTWPRLPHPIIFSAEMSAPSSAG